MDSPSTSTNKESFCEQTDIDQAITKLDQPGTFFLVEFYDQKGKYLSIYDIQQPFDEDFSIQMYCVSMHDANVVMHKIDFFNSDNVLRIKPILESYNIIKIAQKSIYISYILHQQYDIQLNSVFDLTSIIHMINSDKNRYNCHFNLKIVEPIGNDVKKNMARLMKVWIVIYSTIFSKMNQTTNEQLEMYRSEIQ